MYIEFIVYKGIEIKMWYINSAAKDLNSLGKGSSSLRRGEELENWKRIYEACINVKKWRTKHVLCESKENKDGFFPYGTLRKGR